LEALYTRREAKLISLRRVNLNLEKLRVFWRLICDRHWISQQQLLFVSQRLDEIGRMAGGWLRQLEPPDTPDEKNLERQLGVELPSCHDH